MDRSKKIKDIEPIELARANIKSKEDLEKYIEEPLLPVIERLYDLNINTYMCSANRKDVKSKSAYLSIYFDQLSEENKKMMELLSKNLPKKFEIKDVKSFSILYIIMPVTAEITSGEISDYFMQAIQSLKLQDITYGYTDDLRKYFAGMTGMQPEEITDELLDEFTKNSKLIEYEGIYYEEPEILRRHMVYVNSQKTKNDKTKEIDE